MILTAGMYKNKRRTLARKAHVHNYYYECTSIKLVIDMRYLLLEAGHVTALGFDSTFSSDQAAFQHIFGKRKHVLVELHLFLRFFDLGLGLSFHCIVVLAAMGTLSTWVDSVVEAGVH